MGCGGGLIGSADQTPTHLQQRQNTAEQLGLMPHQEHKQALTSPRAKGSAREPSDPHRCVSNPTAPHGAKSARHTHMHAHCGEQAGEQTARRAGRLAGAVP